MIDSEDKEKCQKYIWGLYRLQRNHGIHKSTNDYIQNNQAGLLHRYLIDVPKNMCVDHIDGDSFNNQKSNLRICTITENSRNRKIQQNNKSGCTGVYFNDYAQSYRCWNSTIRVDKKAIYIGCFQTYEEARQARIEAEWYYFGEFNRREDYLEHANPEYLKLKGLL